MNIGTYVSEGTIGTFGDQPAPVEVVPEAAPIVVEETVEQPVAV